MSTGKEELCQASVAYIGQAEEEELLRIASRSLEEAVCHDREWKPDLSQLPPKLQELGSSFVTLHTHGELHGCIGTVIPVRPLALDVAANAVSAALNDPRFPPLLPEELPFTAIEISVLGPLQLVQYQDMSELVQKIRPGIDGVLVKRGWHRGLLLPQVWRQIPSCEEFLAHVALKAGLSPSVYEEPGTEVYVFQVQSFERPAPAEVVISE
ncbi:MAG: AmmeMemoRadiSam system protein A [Anaerolineae bacterium]|nr:AmmeMemoRadiSam system protein A [Anaerolineae bacterium]MDW8098923.1 AmmeMemoRadiSam system protein A [Anaerolineae bacterium]